MAGCDLGQDRATSNSVSVSIILDVFPADSSGRTVFWANGVLEKTCRLAITSLSRLIIWCPQGELVHRGTLGVKKS